MESLAPFNTILLYPGRCTMLNMVRVQRMKKKEGGKESNVSQLWEIEDEDDYLIVRVFFTSHPWLIVHHGVNEIVKAPLVVFIDDEDLVGNQITLSLRDTANRGNECIRRKFIFDFHTHTDAEIFQHAHNLTLLDHSRRVTSNQDGKKRKLYHKNEDINERDKSRMKERFEKGDKNTLNDDNNEETQNPWDDDEFSL